MGARTVAGARLGNLGAGVHQKPLRAVSHQDAARDVVDVVIDEANFAVAALAKGRENVERDPHRPAVLLVHGYLCNRAVWRPLLASRALAHCNVATVNLQPVFAPIDAYADAIASAVQRLRAASGAARVVLIGHSMGGIAIRAYLRKHGDEHVARAITIGSPHAGTVLGRLGHGVNARQMARGGAYMAALQAALTAAPRAKFVCLASRDDNMIIPRASALIPGTRHVVFDRVGHLAMVEDARVWRALAELVETAAA